jgi:hypothetical protein
VPAPTTLLPSPQPLTARTGPPHMPKIFGIKPRKQYLPWSHAEERLARSRNYWICTARPDGRPHSTPVWGLWLDHAFYFGTARSSCKARNLGHDSAVSIHLESGADVIILEGRAFEVTDHAVFKKLDSATRTKYKIPLLIISEESIIYRVQPRVVLAWLEKDLPGTATRWEFGGS